MRIWFLISHVCICSAGFSFFMTILGLLGFGGGFAGGKGHFSLTQIGLEVTVAHADWLQAVSLLSTGITDLSYHAELHLGLLDSLTVCLFYSLKETGGDEGEGEEGGAVYNLCEPCQYPPVCSRRARPVCTVSVSLLCLWELETQAWCILSDTPQW